MTQSTGITSSNLSSSVSGNMDLIQSQLKQKANNYINIRNAVKILEDYSNWNGYIKLYTEVESNFEVGDTVYITNTAKITGETYTYSIENPYNFNSPFTDYSLSKYYLGYKVLYVNKYKNEIVINRYYNDIPSGYKLKYQYISKFTCKGGVFYNDISDGAIFFGKDYQCNIMNGQFGTITGLVTGSIISGATISCAGLTTTSDLTGRYSFNAPSGTNIIKCSAPGYITRTIIASINANQSNTVNINLTGGTNSITIYSNPDPAQICTDGLVIFSISAIGYDPPVNYQWMITNITGMTTNVGTNNYTLYYSAFNVGDTVSCEVSDNINSNVSNSIPISFLTKSVTISASPSNIIYQGDTVIFSATTVCYTSPTYQWRVNNIPVGINNTYSSSTLVNNDFIDCIINSLDHSNVIIMIVSTTTTTTTLPPTTTTLPPTTTTLPPTTTTLPPTTTTTTTKPIFIPTTTTTTTLPPTTTSTTTTTTTLPPTTTSTTTTTTTLPPTTTTTTT